MVWCLRITIFITLFIVRAQVANTIVETGKELGKGAVRDKGDIAD